jgi:hypothetical protein
MSGGSDDLQILIEISSALLSKRRLSIARTELERGARMKRRLSLFGAVSLGSMFFAYGGGA